MEPALPPDGPPSERPVESPHAAYYRLIEAYLLLGDGDQRVLGGFGLTPSQFAVLKRLDPVEGVRPMDLTGPLLLEKSSVSRLLDRLVEEQLVRRVAVPSDRRSHRVVITERGVALREQARLAHERSLDARLSALSPAERQQLDRLLDTLCRHLHRTLGADEQSLLL
jgi:MarR family transcriptional regulator, 2-MHQ and catechol-resistance regulon repressor